MDTTKKTDQEMEEMAERIEAIYAEAAEKIRELEKKQHEIANDFIKGLEEEKIKKIKESLQKGE